MADRIYTLAQRPQLRSEFARLHDLAWPPFLRDDAVNAVWPQLYTAFPEYQLAVCDADGSALAVGNTIPLDWNGRAHGLPDRIVDIIRRGIATQERGRQPTALSALAAIVDPSRRAQGLSGRMISAMRDVAAAHGLRWLVAPVRPSLKGRYPLTPMARYVRWTQSDGAPLDPWLRVHWRLGAKLARITPRGNTVVASVDEWEERTGLRFPESGRYVVPDAFQPIVVDRRRNRVKYDEANVWMIHRTGVATRSAPSARR